ncbi:hypothetical protein [Tahibacter sp.]|uniref:hypothetical protein n=1 Tax=Tahibacter sp. TaxID=2056211 RepID=UPI0028C48046|nr:hypothetical protein [Tahibacter sp.]
MLSRLRNCLAALMLAGAAFPAAAHDGPLDLRFGDGGMRNYSFQSVNGSGRTDRAAVACAGPDGTLVVTGIASEAQRIVTMRLLPDGAYDPAFGGGDGRESFALPATPEYFTAGLCLPEARILLARRVRVDESGEMNIQLLRIDANTGLLDPAFGQNGVVMLDLDTWQGGLGRTESPYALVALDGGEVLLTGHASLPDRIVAFAALVTTAGQIPVARVYVDAPDRETAATFMTAMLASDGNIWGVIEGKQRRSDRVTPFRVRFDRRTLEWLDVPDALPGTTGDQVYGGVGTRVREDVLAVPLLQHVAGTTPPQSLPGLMIYRAGGKVFLPLPPPNLPGESLNFPLTYGTQSATLLPGGRVLFAAAVGHPGDNAPRGMHLAVVQVGTSIGSDRVDTSFGVNGAQTAAFRPIGGSCTNVLAAQRFSAGTVWAGQPVLVGDVDSGCNNDGGGIDYLVARIAVDRIFANGLD